MACSKYAHEFRQTIRITSRSKDQVDMLGHQVIRQHINIEPALLVAQVLEIKPIVLRYGKNGVAIITALHNVAGKPTE